MWRSLVLLLVVPLGACSGERVTESSVKPTSSFVDPPQRVEVEERKDVVEEDPCPDGMMDRRAGNGGVGYGFDELRLEPGDYKQFCFQVGAPLIPDDVEIQSIWVNWDDLASDQCLDVEVKVEQLFGERITRGPAISPNGGYRFVRFGTPQYNGEERPEFPERVQRGLYRLSVRYVRADDPQDPKCQAIIIGWGWR